MENIEKNNNINAEFGVILEESASALTQGWGRRAPEFTGGFGQR